MNFFNIFTKSKKKPAVEPILNETAWWQDTYFGNALGQDKYNPDELTQKKGSAIYQKMLRDPQIKAAYNLLVNIIVSRGYTFELYEDTKEQEKIRAFFEYNIKNSIKGTFVKALKGIMLAKVHGFSLSEKNHAVKQWEGKTWWMIDSVKPKHFADIQIEHDAYGNVKAFYQGQDQREKKLRKEKFIYYVHQPEYDPIWGESDFRAIYRAYWEKDNILKFWDIYLERSAGGFVVATPRDTAPILKGSEKIDFENTLSRITQMSAVRVPQGYDVNYIDPKSTEAFEKAVIHRDKQIAKGLLVPNLLGFSEQGAVGSYSQAQTQFDAFLLVIQEQAELLADTLNEQFFKELGVWNFGTENIPLFKFEVYSEQQKKDISKIWVEAIKGNAVINTHEDEKKTRNLLGYPARDLKEGSIVKSEKKQDVEKIDNKQEFKKKKPLVGIMDIENSKETLDTAEKATIDLLSNLTDKFFKSVVGATKETLNKYKANKKIKLDEELRKLDSAIDNKDKSQMNNGLRKELRIVYEKARVIAQDELIKKLKKIPEKNNLSLGLAIVCGKRFAVKFNVKKPWSVLNFVSGVSLDDIDKILPAISFYITGDISNEIVEKARVAIVQGIENDKSIDQVIDDLKEMLSPLIGKSHIDKETGKVIIDMEERARLENIARTNISSVFNQAQVSVFLSPELGDFVEAFQYSSILDGRTSEFCRQYDGFIRPKNDMIWGSITPPNHFQCRSRLVAATVLDEWEATKNLPKEKGVLIQPSKGFGNIEEN